MNTNNLDDDIIKKFKNLIYACDAKDFEDFEDYAIKCRDNEENVGRVLTKEHYNTMQNFLKSNSIRILSSEDANYLSYVFGAKKIQEMSFDEKVIINIII